MYAVNTMISVRVQSLGPHPWTGPRHRQMYQQRVTMSILESHARHNQQRSKLRKTDNKKTEELAKKTKNETKHKSGNTCVDRPAWKTRLPRSPSSSRITKARSNSAGASTRSPGLTTSTPAVDTRTPHLPTPVARPAQLDVDPRAVPACSVPA